MHGLSTRRLPIGAETSDGQTRFRVWAPSSRSVDVRLQVHPGTDTQDVSLESDDDGYFQGTVRTGVGTRYQFVLDKGEALPDPASRWQPEGPHGVSVVVDPSAFQWTDRGWAGMGTRGLVLYEMHIGTFTREGTWTAAARELPHLARLGITTIEVMPIADFPGRFGWGYDGVSFFAPTHLYGTPDDARAFVDAAHGVGLGVVLDVVYNHAGPDGCWLDRFSPHYFSDKPTDWGRAFNFDGPSSSAVREFFVTNAAYWIEEFHFDGLRLDATQQIFDTSSYNIMQAVADSARQAAGGRTIWMVGENEPQDTRLMRAPDAGGYGIDALWNDDLHHTAMVAATGMREAYYLDYLGAPQEFIACAQRGFLYQGQWYSWQKQGRGTPTTGLPPWAFVGFLQNHDQIANSLAGARLDRLTPAGRHRTLTTMLLLGPWTPMLFQGQEFSASAPFLYFADHQAPLCDAVSAGRREFLQQFPTIVDALRARHLDAPHDPATFRRSQIDHAERHDHAAVWRMHQSLLALRRSDPAFAQQGEHPVAGAVLGPHAFVLRFTPVEAQNEEGARLLILNFGEELALPVAPEPLLAPPRRPWRLLWSSDDETWDGPGAAGLAFTAGWRIPAESAWVLG